MKINSGFPAGANVKHWQQALEWTIDEPFVNPPVFQKTFRDCKKPSPRMSHQQTREKGKYNEQLVVTICTERKARNKFEMSTIIAN